MLVQKGVANIESSALGPKPDVILPFYAGSRGPSPETTGINPAEEQENRIIIIESEKPDIELPVYRRYENVPSEPAGSNDPAGIRNSSRRSGKHRVTKLDWSANIRTGSPEPQYEVVGEKPDIILPLYESPVPNDLDWSAKIESQAPAEVTVPTHRIQSPESKVMGWSADPPAYEMEYTKPHSPGDRAKKVPLLGHTWTPKEDEELKLDMQQDDVINRINSVSMREKTRKRRSVTASFKQRMFKKSPARSQFLSKAEIVNYVPVKTEPPTRRSNRRTVRDEVDMNMRNVYREQNQNKAREIEFSFPTEPQPLPIVPPLAKQFIDEAQLVRTETGELAYELDEDESYLLKNCDKHPYLRRSQTEPRALDMLNSPERTEFGTVIRRSGTVTIPTCNVLSETELQDLADFMGYKKLCQLEKQYTTESVGIIDRKLSLVQQLTQLPKEECVIPSPPPSTPTPTPPPSPVEYTPMQYQYAVPSVDVRLAAAEDTPRPVSRRYTEVITPPAVTPIPEETAETVETVMALKEEDETSDLIKKRDTPSAMSFRGGSRASQEGSFEAPQQRSQSSKSVDSFCGKLVDGVLLRINFDKEESLSLTPLEKEPTPNVRKDLTYTVVGSSLEKESAPVIGEIKPTSERSHSRSSGKSYCVKLVDEVVCLSTAERKEEPPAIVVEIAASPRSHSRTSESDVTISSLQAESRMSGVSNLSERRRVKIELDPESPYIMHHIDRDIAVQAAQQEVESSISDTLRIQDFLKYKRRFMKMSQKKRIEELSEQDIRKTEITENVYLGGKGNMNNQLAPLSPPRSPASSDTTASLSPDEKEGFDSENDKGLMKILDQIRSLTNASIGEMKTYNKPPVEVHAVVKCVFMILGENPKRLEHWQECVILLSKLGRKHVRRRVLRMRKDRVTPDIRNNARKLLAGWTSYDIAQRSRVCVLFFIWCKEICDLNDRPEDNPLLPVVMGRFMNQQHNSAVMSRIFTSRASPSSGRISAGILPGEENPRMVLAAARAFKMNRATRRKNVLPPVTRTPASSRTPA